MTRIALDGMALRRDGRGIRRALEHILPALTDQRLGLEGVVLTTEEGAEILGSHSGDTVIIRKMCHSAWEQIGLPWYATKVGAHVVYSQAACAPLWGPPLLLHFTDDPLTSVAVGATLVSPRECAKRLYQRLSFQRGLERARVVATYTSAIADGLRQQLGSKLPNLATIPLGVDSTVFYPDPADGRNASIFHLGSPEPRDNTISVVCSYVEALRLEPALPDLVVAGSLGSVAATVVKLAHNAGIGRRVRLLGRISDTDLRRRYAESAMCVQPARYEGFGLQPLEALACGAPLVVLRDPSVEEVVGAAAVVIDSCEASSLSAAIVSLWRDPLKRAKLKESGPKRAELFSWHRTVRRLQTQLLKIVQETEGAPRTAQLPESV